MKLSEKIPIYQKANLFIAPIIGEFSFAFNPNKSHGPIVISQATLRLLESFQTPRSLFEGVSSIESAPEAFEMARHLVENGLLVQQGSNELVEQLRPNTLTAWLHITENCNLQCDYCYLEKYPRSMQKDIGCNAIDTIFRSAVRYGYKRVKIKYAGGEPTLQFPLIVELHKYAQYLSKGTGLELDGVVLSNGVALTSAIVQSLIESNLRLMISLDGLDEFQDCQRHFINNKGSYLLVLSALDLLDKMQFRPTISITLSRQSLPGLSKLIKFVLERKYPFSVNFYRENRLSENNSYLGLSNDELIEALELSFNEIENSLPSYSLLNSLLDRTQLSFPHYQPCGACRSYLVVRTDGTITKCHMDFNNPVSSIWAEDPLHEVRSSFKGVHNINVLEKEECGNCFWRFACAGGCPILTKRMQGTYNAQSPYCEVYQKMLPKVLRLEALRMLKHSRIS